MAPLKEQERRDFLEICDDRYQRRSTICTFFTDAWPPTSPTGVNAAGQTVKISAVYPSVPRWRCFGPGTTPW